MAARVSGQRPLVLVGPDCCRCMTAAQSVRKRRQPRGTALSSYLPKLIAEFCGHKANGESTPRFSKKSCQITFNALLVAAILTAGHLHGAYSFTAASSAISATKESTSWPLWFGSAAHSKLPSGATAAAASHSKQSRRTSKLDRAQRKEVAAETGGRAEEKEQQLKSISNANQTSGAHKAAALQSQLIDLRRQLELELSLEGHREAQQTPLIGRLGSPCTRASDCARHTSNSHCRTDTFTCACLPLHVALNGTTCLASALLGYQCQLDAQCQQRIPDSHCHNSLCECQSGFVAHRKDKCLAPSNLNDFCLNDSQCRLAGDRHAHCKWRIPNVYGTCRCPPNYKLISLNSTTTRCAPRLGDSCWSDEECRWATPNSRCSPQVASADAAAASLGRQWPTWRTAVTGGSRRACSCGAAFRAAANQLDCLPALAQASESDGGEDEQRQIGGQQLIGLATPLANAGQHHYEMVPSDSSQATATSLSSDPLDIKLLSLSTTSSTTTTTTTTTTPEPTTSAPSRKESQPFRVSSLGKRCSSSSECEARDPNSYCAPHLGVCECKLPSSKCSANSTGCHGDTFQCRNGQCISWYFVCDKFKNCDDGSDELECVAGACPREAFQCLADGHCVSRGQVCDGRRDCRDGSDEFNCGTGSTRDGDSGKWRPPLEAPSNATSNRTLAWANQKEQHQQQQQHQEQSERRCNPLAFTCHSGQCLPAYVFCNAVADCADGSDELESLCERRMRTQLTANSGSAHAKLTAVSQKSASSATTAAATSLGVKLDASQDSGNKESPLIRTDRLAIERLLAALGPLSLGARVPQNGRPKPTRAQIDAPNLAGPASSQHRASGDGRTSVAHRGRQSRLIADSGGGGTGTGIHRSQSSLLIGPSECPRDSFTCANGKCRSSAILCSGVDGCGDNSDETHCEVCQCAAPPPPA